MAKIKVNLRATVATVICAPENDRWFLQFRTAETAESGEPYTVALSLQSGLELLGLLEQARKHNRLPILTPVSDPIIVPPATDRH